MRMKNQSTEEVDNAGSFDSGLEGKVPVVRDSTGTVSDSTYDSGLPNPNEPVSKLRRGKNSDGKGIVIVNDTVAKKKSIKHTASQEQIDSIPPSSIALDMEMENPDSVKNGAKSKKLLPIIGGVALVVVLAVGLVIAKSGSSEQVAVMTQYEQTGRYALDTYLNSIINYDVDTIRGLVPDSYIAKELAYANKSELRETFIKTVCGLVEFDYSSVPATDANGNQIVKDGDVVMQVSAVADGELITVTVPDYSKLSVTMAEEAEAIQKMYRDAGYAPTDYTFNDEMVDLMLSYLLNKPSLPTTHVSISASLGTRTVTKTNEDGIEYVSKEYYVKDDSELDKVLFSSDDFHTMCDTFTKVATNWTGYKTVEYEEQVLTDNPEYVEWKKLLDKYMALDEGVFNRATSKWEPWYLRDENNNYILDENGEKVVNYYTIKDDDGNDIMQPDEKIYTTVTKTQEVSDDFVPESGVYYTWIGAYYCENEYDGDSISDIQVGDGSFEHPAGVGTSIVTKVLGDDGKYHDVRVTLTGYWVGDDAISYALSFSEKNRGFDNSSIVKLICYEISVENLEDEDFTFDSEMFLSDAYSNQSARTGTVYGFVSSATVPAGKSVTINDWATSTEIQQKYVCWGKSFGREYDVVWFKLLAGSGDEVDEFDANKSTVNSGN